VQIVDAKTTRSSGNNLEALRLELLGLLGEFDDFYPVALREYERAQQLLLRHYKLFTFPENLSLLAMCASGAIACGKLGLGLYFARIGAKFAYEHQLYKEYANLLNMSARAHARSGNQPKALREYRLVSLHASSHGLHSIVSNAHTNTTAIYGAVGELDMAREYNEKALSIAQQHGLLTAEVAARTNVAALSLWEGNHHGALNEIRGATEIAEHHAAAMPKLRIFTWKTHGDIVFAAEKYDEALTVFERCRAALVNSPFPTLSSEIEFLIARVLVKLGRYQEAVVCLERSAALARETGMDALEARAMFALSQWHAKAANAKEALAALNSFEQAMQANKLAQLDSTRVGIRSVEQIDIAVLREQKRIEEILQDPNELFEGASEVTAFIRESTTDGLTGVLTRRGFDERFDDLVGQSSTGSLCLMMIDVDGYRLINMAHGHIAGDVVLREIANRLRKAIADEKAFARVGGDKFLFLGANISSVEAACLAKRLSNEVSATSIAIEGLRVQVSVSIGVMVAAACRPRLKSGELFEATHAALRLAKQQGKNQIVLAPASAS
jgi:diguanylate cyclase (GGDEF)-like protein